MKSGDFFTEIADRRPDHLLQPWISRDPMSGNRYYVNPEYVRKYGNPYNHGDKSKDIYIDSDNLHRVSSVPTWDIGLNAEQRKRKVKNKFVEDLKRYWHCNYSSYSATQCQWCSAYNPSTRKECWACLIELL